MADLTLRNVKGSPLTITEVDDNFSNLNSDKVEKSGDTLTGDLAFGDNVKAKFGASDDLQIYHDGINSYIKDVGTGYLILGQSDAGTIIKNGSGNNLLTTTSSEIRLAYDGNQKLATKSTGIDVTGTVTADDVTVSNKLEAGSVLEVSSNSPTIRLMEEDVTDQNTFINSSSGNFNIITTNDAVGVFTNRLRIAHSSGDISFYDDAGTSQDFYWDASLSRLGLGTTSPSKALHVQTAVSEILSDGTNNTSGALIAGVSVKANNYRKAGFTIYDQFDNEDFFIGRPYASTNQFVISNDTTDRLRINNAGDVILYADDGISQDFYWDASTSRLGLGTTSPAWKLTLSDGTGNYFHNITGSGAGLGTDNTYPLRFFTNDSEAMRIDSNGRLGIGTTSPANKLDIVGGDVRITDTYPALTLKDSDLTDVYAEVSAGNGNLVISSDHLNNQASSNTLFWVDGSEAMRIDSQGRLGIGTTSPSSILSLGLDSNVSQSIDISGTRAQVIYDTSEGSFGAVIVKGGNKQVTLDTGGVNHPITFKTSNTEAARIDSSGNLLVGRTATWDFSTASTTGIGAESNGTLFASRNSGASGYFRRSTNDGDIVELWKDTNKVGSIGTKDGDLTLGTGDTGLFFVDGQDVIAPWNVTSNIYRSGAIDLGSSSSKFKHVYLTEGLRADTLKIKNIAGTEYGRFDSSGNLLVGGTNAFPSSNNVVGSALKSDGQGQFSRDGGTALNLNRKTSDGQILEFRKDGSTIGDMGSKNSDLYIRNGGVGLRFNDGAVALTPAGSNGNAQDGTVLLGTSGARFKDLFLSGGVYLGGTGSANLLDDYEEGTWTPSLSASTTSDFTLNGGERGVYTKVGNQVTVHGILQISSLGTSSGNMSITGLPFTVANSLVTTSFEASGNIGVFANMSSAVSALSLIAVDGTTSADFQKVSGASATATSGLAVSDVTSSFTIRFTLTYFA